MPELPDITIYREALDARVRGRVLRHVRIINPFLLRTAVPPIADGRRQASRSACGAWASGSCSALEGELFLVLHLMIAGRLRWLAGGPEAAGAHRARDLRVRQRHARASPKPAPSAARRCIACRRRGGCRGLRPGRPGRARRRRRRRFAARLRSENHTLKRALTDPRLFSGIGNAYSDEILHRAQLSPLALTHELDDAEMRAPATTPRARRSAEWTDRLRAEAGDAFPEKVTAFRPEMAVHGRFGQPCPVCGAPVQRIVYAENEMQLLRTLPDRRPHARRPRAVAAAAQELAAVDRRAAADGATRLSRCGRTC